MGVFRIDTPAAYARFGGKAPIARPQTDLDVRLKEAREQFAPAESPAPAK